MSVSSELLCSFELLKPLDSSALKSHIKKGRSKRQQMLNSPVSELLHRQIYYLANSWTACECYATECLTARVLSDCVCEPFLLSLHFSTPRLPLFVSLFLFKLAEKNSWKKRRHEIASKRRHPSYTIFREGLRAHVIKDGETTQHMWLPQATG